MNEIDPKAQEELEKGYKKAEKVLSNEKKLDKVLIRTEKKLNLLPVVGTSLAMIPSMISLVRRYTKKEYTENTTLILTTEHYVMYLHSV